MKVDYTPRAKTDLVEIGEYSRKTFGLTVASALETYMRATVARIAAMPESGVSIPNREGVRVVPLVRYPFRIFYAVIEGHGNNSARPSYGSKAVVAKRRNKPKRVRSSSLEAKGRNDFMEGIDWKRSAFLRRIEKARLEDV